MDINSEKTIEKIGELDFLDTKVPIFYDPKGGDRALISWGIRTQVVNIRELFTITPILVSINYQMVLRYQSKPRKIGKIYQSS